MKKSKDVSAFDATPINKISEEKEKREKSRDEMKQELIKKFYDRCIYHHYGEKWDGKSEYPKVVDNYWTGTTCGNIVGDRIRYILKEENMTISEFSQISGIGRTTLHRYLDNKDPKIPKVSSLTKIVNAFSRFCSYEDFLYSPDDYKTWEDAYSGYPYKFDSSEPYLDYVELKSFFISQLKFPLKYKQGEKYIPVPYNIAELLTRQIFSAFEMTDLLLSYDKEQNISKGYIEDIVEPEEI